MLFRWVGLRLAVLLLLLTSDLTATVNAQLDADFLATPTSGVNPLTVEFTDATTGGTPSVWQWDFGDGSGSATQHPTHTYESPGVYTVTLVVFEVLLTDTEEKVGFIQVTDADLGAGFSAHPVAGLGLPMDVTFTDETSGSPPRDWLWDFGDGDSSTLQNPSHTYTTPGTYDVSLTVFVSGQSETIVKTEFIQVGCALPQEHKLLPEDGEESDRFGTVAVTGSLVLVGATGDDDFSGSAYLFDLMTGEELSKLTPSDGVPDGSFGQVAIEGNVAAIGAQRDDDNGPESGSVYLFDVTDPRNPQQITKLLPTDGAEGDRFGASVDISGSTVVVGAFHDDDHGTSSGSAYLFDLTTGLQRAKLVPEDGATGDLFGEHVAVSGRWVAVTARRHFPVPESEASGAVYVFDVVTGKQVDKVFLTETEGFDSFGLSVALDGPTAVVGARDSDLAGFTIRSLAYVFNVATGEQVSQLLPNDADGSFNDDSDFGQAVDIRNGLVVIGDRHDDDDGSWSGSAYLFDAATGQQLAKIRAGDADEGDSFGTSVALGRTKLIIGAPRDNDSGRSSGSAYTFDVGAGEWMAWLDLGGAIRGSAGVPMLTGSGTPVVGCPLGLSLSNAMADTSAFLVMGFEDISKPFKGGTLVPSPDLLVEGLTTDGDGGIDMTGVLSDDLAAGTALYFQAWILDPAGPSGFSASNGLSIAAP